MKVTLKQWIFMGVSTGVVVISCVVMGYRAVAPSSNRPSVSESAIAAAKPESRRKPTQSSLGRRRSYSLAVPSNPGDGKLGETTPPGGPAGKKNGPAGTSAATDPETGEAPALASRELVTYTLDEYMAIADVDPFQPIIAAPKPQPKAAPPRPAVRELPPFPVPLLLSALPEEPQESQELELFPLASAPPPVASPPPEPEGINDLAVTGYVQTPQGVRILLENVKTREARMVQPGEDSFGYEVKTLDRATGQLILEKKGREFRLKLGNNKQESPKSQETADENEGDNSQQTESGGVQGQ